jgi:hypothetical protein
MWVPRFIFALPMAMLCIAGTDSLLVTRQWDYYPIPAYSELESRHDGFGRPIRCEVSGEWFPESRIMTQWDGKKVGDLYYTLGPRPYPF